MSNIKQRLITIENAVITILGSSGKIKGQKYFSG